MKKKKLSANTRRGIRSVVCFVCLIACMISEKTLSGLPVWLMPVLFAVVYLVSGYDVLKKCVVNICHGQIFDENFLMTVASVGAFLLREYAEAAAVMIFYQVGETFQSYAVGKSRNSISSLMTLRPDVARKVKETGTEEVAPEEICVGDVIEVRAGERIPLDGTLIEGSCYLDTSALTGESVPVFAETGSSVLSGSIVSDGVIKVRAENFTTAPCPKFSILWKTHLRKRRKRNSLFLYLPNIIRLPSCSPHSRLRSFRLSLRMSG